MTEVKNTDTANNDSAQDDQAVAAGGAYDVIRKRLQEQGRLLAEKSKVLNKARLDEFGSTDMSVVGRVRVRTENNCVARDIVHVGNSLLFGYNVFIGMKKETQVEDVFSLFQLQKQDTNFDLVEQPLAASFLKDATFERDFRELYAYYKNARLLQLTVKNQTLLACFQIGDRIDDVRVFRWSISADGDTIKYIDNRGERDIELPATQDFEWTEVKREDTVSGRHPHFNILDKVFVETTGGDLTIKVEDNTEDGRGIYAEPVDDKTQSLDDADIFYADLNDLILLKIKPYREKSWRYLIFNNLNQQVDRIDEIGQACVRLPEDHGLIFPGGYYLQNGDCKRFDDNTDGLRFKRAIKSPNGEDVLYVFYEPVEGRAALFAYNMIEKQLQNPIFCHGYGLFENGLGVFFNAESEEPTRVHPMQIWQTPYVSDEFANNTPASQTFLGRIGNPELVRGISDLYSVCRSISNQSVSAGLYEDLTKSVKRLFDAYHWLSDSSLDGVLPLLKDIAATANLVIGEFDKVESIRRNSVEALREAELAQEQILAAIHPDRWTTPEEYVEALDGLRRQRGHLMTLRDYRYIDTARIAELDEDIITAEDRLSDHTVAFLSQAQALLPFHESLAQIDSDVEGAGTIVMLAPLLAQLEKMAAGLDLLSELMAGLKVDDATVRTAIIDAISEVYAKLNQSRARAKHSEKNLGRGEAVAQFSAQFKLFSQSITNALGLATTPDKCDEQMSRLLIQLEELEGQFSAFDEFLADIMGKRDEVYESFESHKQTLIDERQRRATNLADAADRIIGNITRRAQKFTEVDELNSYFAADTLLLKSRELVEQLRELGDAVKADDIESRLKSAKDMAVRALRDKSDIYEDGGNVIKLGPKHKFSVNTQELDLTIIPRNGELYSHLTGTDFYQPIQHPDLESLKHYWQQALISETEQVCRAEYLAYSIYTAADEGRDNLSSASLRESLHNPADVTKLVRDYAAPRYQEGFEKGIHDGDAAKILSALIPVFDSCDLLRFEPECRALAVVFWANTQRETPQQSWLDRAHSALQMLHTFNRRDALALLNADVTSLLQAFVDTMQLPQSAATVARAAEYLVLELARERLEFITSKYAQQLQRQLKQQMDVAGAWKKYQASLKNLQGQAGKRWLLTKAWLEAMVDGMDLGDIGHYIPEAIALINAEERISRRHTELDLQFTVTDLMAEHPRITQRSLDFSLDEFLQRMEHHHSIVVPGYQHYLATRQHIIEQARSDLRIDEFKPKPLSSFVRNKLINEAYLPLIGDNLAKQMGTLGDNKRTDLMGLLMMISPPGYGKTTLMEYVASRLGLVFMKINCPSLGHDVLSLDPAQAPNATAKQELEKINLSFEMGSNVMLYLDDIQHTHPEFLQKFISLCDGTRRVEGIWQGKSKTYDMRGKKFCVVMAGNPYTESGEMFKIPDMLANRADIYNLGDVLGGMDEVFALSYIENSLTSNPVLSPLATREMDDVYKLVDMARGVEVANSELSHNYSGAEVGEIISVLKKMFAVQDVILKVNQQYIASAAQADKYRTEPSFKLQGSYRNMNKMAEKISSVMNEAELQQMINDHYLGEAQLLTVGAEENLLKLKALRGVQSVDEAQRWQDILREFNKQRTMGGDDADSTTKLANQLAEVAGHMEDISGTLSQGIDLKAEQISQHKSEQKVEQKVATIETQATADLSVKHLASISQSLRQSVNYGEQLASLLGALQTVSESLGKAEYKVEVINQPVPGFDRVLGSMADTIEHSIYPLVKVMEGKLGLDLRTHDKLEEVLVNLRGQGLSEQVTRVSHSPLKEE